MKKLIATLFILACSCIIVCTKKNSTNPETEDNTIKITIPDKLYPTIQSGIDAITVKGIISLKPGTYTESLTITNKNIDIVAEFVSDSEFVEVAGLNIDRAVITFGPNGGGKVQDITLKGGNAGIRGIKAGPAAVELQNVKINETERGISGYFSELKVQESVIEQTEYGFVLFEIEALKTFSSIITNTKSVGILIYNMAGSGQEKIEISNTSLIFNSQGGIVIVGDADDIYFNNCGIAFSGIAGVLLIETGFVEIKDTNIMHIANVETSIGIIGDGVLVNKSDFVDINNCWLYFCDRAGVVYDGSAGILQNTLLEYDRFGISIQNSPQFVWNNQNNTFLDIKEKNVLSDGNLPIPDMPPAIPSPL
jgi:hypothetical protein